METTFTRELISKALAVAICLVAAVAGFCVGGVLVAEGSRFYFQHFPGDGQDGLAVLMFALLGGIVAAILTYGGTYKLLSRRIRRSPGV